MHVRVTASDVTREGLRVVDFKVNEEQRVTLDDVFFAGLELIDDDELEDLMDSLELRLIWNPVLDKKILESDIERLKRYWRGLAPTRRMHMPDTDCYLIAEDQGLYEALVDLNAPVAEGDAVGQIHFPANPERAPVVCRARRPGILIGRTHKVPTEPGDFLALISLILVRTAS